MDPRQFLTTLWGDPPPSPVLVWILPQKQSKRYDGFDHLNEDLAAYPECDIYTGAGFPVPGTNPLAPNLQGVASEIGGIAGMWADVDVAHPLNEKTSQLPTMDQAFEILYKLPFIPTIKVDSGSGLQALWLFNNVWTFDGQDDNTLAQTLTQWWHQEIRNLFAVEGLSVDTLHDLTSVLRIPGTVNNKDPDHRADVKIISNYGPRYELSELIALIPGDLKLSVPVSQEKVAAQVAVHRVVLAENAEPPGTKLARLIEKDPQFWATWQERRDDLPDESPSSYETALASIAVRAGWTDQETVNLMIAWRRERRHPSRHRIAHYAGVIKKAKIPMERLGAEERLSDSLDQKTVDQAEILRGCLNEVYGITITKLIKFAGDPPTFRMETDKGAITIGDVHNLIDQRSFREMVAAATETVIPKCNEEAWHQRSQALLSACEDVDVGDESHPVPETLGWLQSYLSDRGISDDVDQAASNKRPLIYCDYTHIQLFDFTRWVLHNTGERLRSRVLAMRLRLCGANPVAVPVNLGGRRTTRSYWRLPDDSS